MADVLTIAQRSYNMSRIRSENTGPEQLLQRMFVLRGLSDFEMQPKQIPGRPDFYFPNSKSAVFVDGCFWHGCKNCFKEPQTNQKFWSSKIGINMTRDRIVNRKLSILGITIIRVKEHELKTNPQVVLKNIKKKLSVNTHRPKVLDLFAGAGGLSEGFIRAGCEMIGHIEMDKNASSTLVTRMIYHALRKRRKLDEYKKYILGKITRDELIEKYGLQKERNSIICEKIGNDNYKNLIEQIRAKLNEKQLDIIVGGPPCQAYSYIGRARNKNIHRDERNFLYKYYVEFLKALKPKIFVFENVPGLQSAGKGKYLKDMQRLMKRAGYTTDYKILNAADFGVPQNRKRIILVGWSKNSNFKSYPEFPIVERNYTVKDFLSDLPKVRAGKGEVIRKFTRKNELLKKLGILRPNFRFLMDHVARPNTEQDLEIYRLAVLVKQKGENIKYNNLPKRLKTHNNEKSFLDRFKVIDGNMRGSHTIVAHLAKDGHFYIHPDLKQNRSITVREAARLQTFPDDYKFEGERGSRFKQIGNAVPPMLSEIIAKELLMRL